MQSRRRCSMTCEPKTAAVWSPITKELPVEPIVVVPTIPCNEVVVGAPRFSFLALVAVLALFVASPTVVALAAAKKGAPTTVAAKNHLRHTDNIEATNCTSLDNATCAATPGCSECVSPEDCQRVCCDAASEDCCVGSIGAPTCCDREAAQCCHGFYGMTSYCCASDTTCCGTWMDSANLCCPGSTTCCNSEYTAECCEEGASCCSFAPYHVSTCCAPGTLCCNDDGVGVCCDANQYTCDPTGQNGCVPK